MAIPTLDPSSQTSAVILPQTGSFSVASTSANYPYGLYVSPTKADGSTSDLFDLNFITGAVEQVTFTFRKLGGDILDIELTEKNVYAAYEEAGVRVVGTAKALWEGTDVVVKVLGPDKTELKYLNASKTLISFFWPSQNSELLDEVNKTGATALAMDTVPRISRAQKMDALSSMANIAGYRAVIEAGNNFGRFFFYPRNNLTFLNF